jgi:hypothetical protein
MYLFSKACILVLVPPGPLFRYWGVLTMGVKWPRHDANLSSTKIKHPLLHTPSWHAWGQIYVYLLGCDTMYLEGRYQ